MSPHATPINAPHPDHAHVVRMKRCSLCTETKPLDAFGKMSASKDGRYPQCLDCRKGKQSKPTARAVLRSRAQARAHRDLKEAHEGEFAVLLAFRLAEVKAEAAELAETPEAAEHFTGTVPRLTGGRRRESQTALDRIDVARCPDCVRHHDGGHACGTCGATPENPAPVRLQRRRPVIVTPRFGTSGLDPQEFRDFNAGTARAARGHA